MVWPRHSEQEAGSQDAAVTGVTEHEGNLALAQDLLERMAANHAD